MILIGKYRKPQNAKPQNGYVPDGDRVHLVAIIIL